MARLENLMIAMAWVATNFMVVTIMFEPGAADVAVGQTVERR